MIGGRLVRPFEKTVRSPRAYYMAVPLAMVENPVVVAFGNWLRTESEQSFAFAKT